MNRVRKNENASFLPSARGIMWNAYTMRCGQTKVKTPPAPMKFISERCRHPDG